MFYNLYNVDSKEVGFWWTGLLLPIAYAKGNRLQTLMGPLYDYRKEIIDELSKIQGAYLRCMNEDATWLLNSYQYELQRGNAHYEWLEASKAYGEFLVNSQTESGFWYRAYSTDGKPIIEPQTWFGSNIYEQASSTASSIPFLINLYNITKNEKYLDCAKRAGVFVKNTIIDPIKFNGGVHDSIYSKGELIDNEGILYPMLGMFELYKVFKDNYFFEGTIRAAHLFASWVCLWDVPLPPESTLAKYNFRSTGLGACDTCGAGYLHPFQLMGVSELAQIAILAHEKELFEIARLYWLGCNETVQLPERDWGYRYYGLQEEGYLVSWWAVDDPMFSSDKEFGHRWKGEGNKTCFPWISAVGVKAYWSLIDAFGTTDFDRIEREYF